MSKPPTIIGVDLAPGPDQHVNVLVMPNRRAGKTAYLRLIAQQWLRDNPGGQVIEWGPASGKCRGEEEPRE